MAEQGRFPIEEGHILSFARAIGDLNPLYTDRDKAAASGFGGVIAPPTFVRASVQFLAEHRQRPVPGRPWRGSAREPSGGERPAEGEGRGLLAEQHFEYQRPVRAGEVLSFESSPGRTWQKQGKRAGTLVFTETITEYRDAAGEIVVTARSVSVLTERAASRA